MPWQQSEERDGVERCEPTELQVAAWGNDFQSINKVSAIQLFGKRPKGSSMKSFSMLFIVSNFWH